MATAAISLTALAASLGAYMRKNTDQLMASFMMELQSTSLFQVLPGIKDEFPLIPVTVGEIVQPNLLNNAWNPTANAIDFKPRMLKVRDCKVDLEIIPQLLHKTWLGHMAKAGAADNSAAAIPFEAFLMEQIIKAAKRDIEKKAIYTGVYNAAGTAPADTMDGLLTTVVADITSGTIPGANVVVTGNITSANAVDQFELVYASVPDELKQDDLVLLCSPTTARYYSSDYRSTFGALPYNQEFKKTLLDGTQVEIVPIAGFGNTGRIIITSKDNVFIGVDLESDMDQLDVQQFYRALAIMMSFRIGIQYADPAIMFVNDVTVNS